MNRNSAGERNSSSPSSPRGSHQRDEVIAITSLALIQDADKRALLICAGPIEGTAARLSPRARAAPRRWQELPPR